jgi:peptidoglycan/xylan/chitin deacetylase (PgdA/CDA1 family)
MMLPVLMYHSVSYVDDGPMRPLAVPPRQLTDQLTALRDAGYTLLGLTEALARHDADPLAHGLVAVTFDDGFVNFGTAGLAALDAAGARATLYLAAGHLGGPATWLGARANVFGALMTWSEVDDVVQAGVEIGSHNLVHTPMDVLPAVVMARQVRDARRQLQQHTATRVPSFAYPHGYHNRAVRAAVAQAGHDTACAVGHRTYDGEGHRYAIPRLQVTPDHTPDDVVTLVATGGPTVIPALKRAAQPGWRFVRRAAHKAGVRLT